MGASETTTHGIVAWADLTIAGADQIRDFYHAVVGWDPLPIRMGSYNDYQMNAPGTDQPVAGICHARGVNADLPPQWLLYVTVPDIGAAIAACTGRGGSVITGPREMGAYGRFCVIRDPVGAVLALLETPPAPQQSDPKAKDS